jgi:hypothetical protein
MPGSNKPRSKSASPSSLQAEARMADATVTKNYWFDALALPLTVLDALADT